MPELLKVPVTPAQQARDALLGALVGLARATTSEPKTDDTDEVLNAGLRLAAQPDAPEERLQRMLAIVQTEKHRVAPGCATCAMPCGNTNCGLPLCCAERRTMTALESIISFFILSQQGLFYKKITFSTHFSVS